METRRVRVRIHYLVPSREKAVALGDGSGFGETMDSIGEQDRKVEESR